MTFTVAVFSTVVVYTLLAVLLLSLNIASLWRWWIKAGAILLTGAAFVGSYVAITGLLGWAAFNAFPERFSVVWTHIVDPDKEADLPGHLYLWVEEINAENISIAPPRAYEVAYTEEMAQQLYEAQEMLMQGEAVLGEMLEQQGNDQPLEEGAEESAESGSGRGEESDGEEENEAAAGGQQGVEGIAVGALLDLTGILELTAMPAPENMPGKPQ